MPCSLELKGLARDVVIKGHKLKWDNTKKFEYQNKLNNQLSETDEIMTLDKFNELIVDSANDCQMLKRFTIGNIIKKAWFDEECIVSRKCLKNLFKICNQQGWTTINSSQYHVAKTNYKTIKAKGTSTHLTSGKSYQSVKTLLNSGEQ